MALREGKEIAISGKHKVSVREETNAVSDTRVMTVQGRHEKPVHAVSHLFQRKKVTLHWWVLPTASTIKPKGKRICGGLQSKHACGQQERP